MAFEKIEKEIFELVEKVKSEPIPEELKDRILIRLNQLTNLTASSTFLPEFDRINGYIDWVISIPWEKKTADNLDLIHAQEVLDSTHYGLHDIKDRIVEYLAAMKLKMSKGEDRDFLRAPILCFVGLVGTGKTTIAASIAESMGRSFARIPFGGMGSPFDLRGESRMHAEAEPGRVIKALRQTQSRNPVILLDEIDRVTEEGRSSIMGVLVELLDPEQNNRFVDHYIDFPVNLSEVLFVATANNTHNISTAVMDRLEPLVLPSYSDQEKITIGKKYIYPKLLKAGGLTEQNLVIDDEVWAKVVRPLGFDSGMRTLERTINGVVRKVARLIVEGKAESYHVTVDNIKEFLPL
ncbi:AAA family ATPase [Candidatus Woesebacteria bacterium]|nr:MAG: AAA family ATPase [Candidatus Woesebacteria bacterium]